MNQESIDHQRGRVFQIVVTATGIALWLAAAATLPFQLAAPEQLAVLVLTPLACVLGMFPLSFPLPSGLQPTREKINFTLSDAFVLLTACRYGVFAAIFVAGVEGFISSRRGGPRLSSNLFSSGMMSLSSAAAALGLGAVLRYGWSDVAATTASASATTSHAYAFSTISLALLVGGLMQVFVNLGLLSVLLARRQNHSVLREWKANFICAAPLFLPTSAAASLMYLALQRDALIMAVIGVPILLTIYFGHRQHRDGVQERIRLVEESSREQMAVMEKAHRQTIEALAVAINAKDEVTHEHVLRVQIYAAGVARILGCNESEVEALRAGALLHDIGKIAVPDYIINKPGKLTAAEFDRMKFHTIAGAQILGRVEFPYPVVPVVRHHHERWDGRGYPDGLSGETIPLTARILSVVDCFDAVREDRQYRKGLTRDAAIALIMDGSGTQYDPRVVGTFVTHLPEFEAEIQAHRDVPLPTFGIEPSEQLSEAALKVAPAAGLMAEARGDDDNSPAAHAFTHEEQDALNALAQTLNTPGTPQELFEIFTRQLNTLVSFDTCTLTRVSPASGECVVAHAAGRNAALLQGRTLAPGEGVTGWTLTNGQPFCNTDPRLDLPAHLASDFADYRTLAVFPISHNQETLGALAVYSAALDEYDTHQQRLLQEAAHIVARAFAARGEQTHQHTALNLPSTNVAAPTLKSELTH